jgi:integrase/recombinase XerD
MNPSDFLKKIETELKISKNSPHTIKNYLLANQFLLNFSKKNPEQMEEDDVKLFMADRLSDKSPMSIILFLSAIRYAYTNILHKDITLGIKRPKRDKKIPEVLTKEEIQKLLGALDNIKSKLMISMIYACGFRVSELLNLKIKDLNFQEKSGFVRSGKGRKDRFFNLPDFLIKDLQKQIAQQQKDSEEFLFTGPNGKLSDRNIQKIVRKAAAKAKIQKSVHVHTLRHSYATHLLENGVDIRLIQALLGHASISTTEIYTHLSTMQLKKVKSPLDELK